MSQVDSISLNYGVLGSTGCCPALVLYEEETPRSTLMARVGPWELTIHAYVQISIYLFSCLLCCLSMLVLQEPLISVGPKPA